ncbi:MAG: hypothetical protein WC685_02590 [Methylobacter sp.]|jgi:hypothetical protein
MGLENEAKRSFGQKILINSKFPQISKITHQNPFKTSSKKQENINEILKAEGSNYQIGYSEVKIGVPPKMVYDLKSLADE